MEKPQLVVLRWSGFSFVAKETRALIYGGETGIFALIEEILPHFPLNFFVMRVLPSKSICRTGLITLAQLPFVINLSVV